MTETTQVPWWGVVLMFIIVIAVVVMWSLFMWVLISSIKEMIRKL